MNGLFGSPLNKAKLVHLGLESEATGSGSEQKRTVLCACHTRLRSTHKRNVSILVQGGQTSYKFVYQKEVVGSLVPLTCT